MISVTEARLRIYSCNVFFVL